MRRIGIRADGGPIIGMGHIMRCLSLANEFRKYGYKVYFLSKLEEGIKKIREQGFEVIYLKGVKEVREVVEAIKEYRIDILFIDSYNISEEYFLQIKPYVNKLGYIDDLNKFAYLVDILINGNITAEYMDYKKYSEDQLMLLGPKYNLTREEFRNLPERKINKQIKEIMITTGGSDPYNMSGKIVNMILTDEKFKRLKINVIVGQAFSNKEALREISKLNSNVILHQNVRKISDIMLRADIAISAGGSTLYELCACGTPTLAFIMAENQKSIVETLDNLGYIISLGIYNQVTRTSLIDRLNELYADFDLRVQLSKRMQSLIDAKGVERIVKEITASVFG